MRRPLGIEPMPEFYRTDQSILRPGYLGLVARVRTLLSSRCRSHTSGRKPLQVWLGGSVPSSLSGLLKTRLMPSK